LPPRHRIGDPRRDPQRRRPARAAAGTRLRQRLRFLHSPAGAPVAPARHRLSPTEVPVSMSAHPQSARRPPQDVVLLSAGPGDLELLTLKAVRALAQAEVLLLDELVDPAIVELAPRARVVRVGKRGGCRSTPQEFICRLMRR